MGTSGTLAAFSIRIQITLVLLLSTSSIEFVPRHIVRIYVFDQFAESENTELFKIILTGTWGRLAANSPNFNFNLIWMTHVLLLSTSSMEFLTALIVRLRVHVFDQLANPKNIELLKNNSYLLTSCS